MRNKFVCGLFVLIAAIGSAIVPAFAQSEKTEGASSGRLEKMIVENGSVSMNLNFSGLMPKRARGGVSRSDLRFSTEANSFFTILVFNGELRGPLPSEMPLVPQADAALPDKLRDSYRQLTLENTSWGGEFDLVVRDSKSGFTYFNIEGHEYAYNPETRQLTVTGGRVRVSREFAAALGRSSEAGAEVGTLDIAATMRAIEVTEYKDGEAVSQTMPPLAGTIPGPDVVVGDVSGLAQFGSSSGTQVGLALGTDSCNFGTVNLNWQALPANDHPVIPQNLYRMSGGTDNAERFEQIGQSNVKHAFTALTNNICSLGCNGVGGSALGSGCSDPYSASLNSGPNLGSRAWINPFTGAFPRGDSATPPNDHAGHTHTGPSHRILVEIADLSTTANPGATYYAEGQYVTPHEFAWCTANPTQCNMNNNVSYRRYNVVGTGSPFTFSAAATTVRQKSAISAWTGASFADFQPAPLQDGIGTVAYKVTNPSPGVWHYEYAVYNQNLDRVIQAFSVPIGAGATVTNIGFHMPPQQPGWNNDGTTGSAGFSSTPWTGVVNGGVLRWASQTFAENANANAIRWGTLYNFRFDSNRPPVVVGATVGFFKTGSPITVQIAAPSTAVSAVTVGGRVTTSAGQPIASALVTITDSQGNATVTRTNSFGFYSFGGINTLSTYTITASVKRMTFNPLQITPTAAVSDANLTAN